MGATNRDDEAALGAALAAIFALRAAVPEDEWLSPARVVVLDSGGARTEAEAAARLAGEAKPLGCRARCHDRMLLVKREPLPLEFAHLPGSMISLLGPLADEGPNESDSESQLLLVGREDDSIPVTVEVGRAMGDVSTPLPEPWRFLASRVAEFSPDARAWHPLRAAALTGRVFESSGHVYLSHDRRCGMLDARA
jgi:hypothetical protein